MHHGCGLLGASEDDFRQALAADGVLPAWRLGAFDDVEETLRHSLARLRQSPELIARDHIRGLRLRPRDRHAAPGRAGLEGRAAGIRGRWPCSASDRAPPRRRHRTGSAPPRRLTPPRAACRRWTSSALERDQEHHRVLDRNGRRRRALVGPGRLDGRVVHRQRDLVPPVLVVTSTRSVSDADQPCGPLVVSAKIESRRVPAGTASGAVVCVATGSVSASAVNDRSRRHRGRRPCRRPSAPPSPR